MLICNTLIDMAATTIQRNLQGHKGYRKYFN